MEPKVMSPREMMLKIAVAISISTSVKARFRNELMFQISSVAHNVVKFTGQGRPR